MFGRDHTLRFVLTYLWKTIFTIMDISEEEIGWNVVFIEYSSMDIEFLQLYIALH